MTTPSPLAIGHLTCAIRNGKTQEFIKTAEAFKTVAGAVNTLGSAVQSVNNAISAIVFPTGTVLMRHDVAGAWTVYGPDGSPVPVGSTTTQGLQEAITFAAMNNYNLVVQGGAINGIVGVINCTTTVAFPP